ncbi:MAG: hypothetical protein KF724_10715 [Phycisphaeraceae bacterium]|nr:hypothetical protein [Phycisphaeraceae bacterium]
MSGLQPHRGTLVLVLGILGLVTTCAPIGVVAFFLGRADLKAMDTGVMDPTGRGMTQAGYICGIIALCLLVLTLLVFVVAAIMPLFASFRVSSA